MSGSQRSQVLRRTSPTKSHLSPVQEQNEWSQSVQTPLRPDASTFKPLTARPSALSATTFDRPASPHYEPPNTPFVPPSPEVPSHQTQTGAWVGDAATETAKPSGQGQGHRASLSGSSFYGLESIWSSPSSGYSHIRGGSDALPSSIDRPSPGTSRPRSRSDAFGALAQPTQGHMSGPGESSLGSSVSSQAPSEIMGPSPRRSLYAAKGVNEQPWSQSPTPVDMSSGTVFDSSGSPERVTRRSRWSMPVEQSQPGSSGGWNAPRHHLRTNTMTYEVGGRDTPGGVALSGQDAHLAQHFGGLHINTGVSNDRFDTQPGASEPSAVSHTSGKRQSFLGQGKDDDCFTSPETYNSPEGTKSHNSSASTPSRIQSAQDAKALAAFIKSGGLENLPIRGPSQTSHQSAAFGSHASVPRYRPPMMQDRVSSYSSIPSRTPVPPPQSNPAQLHSAAMQPSQEVQKWKMQGGPTFMDFAKNMPFVERALTVTAAVHGVIKISDIPFGATKPEIVALVGEKAPMVAMPRGTGSYAIHIIMERSTAKSNDCFVEFETYEAAAAEAYRLQLGRRLVGNRRARIELSSQPSLMEELFPRAKCVTWDDCTPVLHQAQDEFDSGFQGFVTGEEMHATAKIAMNPQRYQFTHRHPQRTYESMISLLAKYPWYYTQLYTLGERNRIFKTTMDQVGALVQHLHKHGSAAPLDLPLLNDLLVAGLKCPGFSDSQRAELIDATGGLIFVKEYVTPIAKEWPFEAISTRDGANVEIILYTLELLRASVTSPRSSFNASANVSRHASITNSPRYSQPTTPSHGSPHYSQAVTPSHSTPTPHMTLAQISRQQSLGVAVFPIGTPIPTKPTFRVDYPDNMESYTMAQIAQIEWRAIEEALLKVLRDDRGQQMF